MIPSILARQLKEGLNDYIETTFPMTNEGFRGTIAEMLKTKDSVFHEPYVSVKMPFRVSENVFDGFKGINLPFKPYIHQEKAWKRLIGDDPLPTLVATGTGSGKTECFMYPILDYCYRHRGEKGIKALVIYPMNALATDQAKRFAEEIFKSPSLKGNITVGMYVGGQEKTSSTAMGEKAVITDHETMLNNPPDILLTNYKMLDYLLVRPKDAKLWEDNKAETLKFIAVDELHTFDGAQCTDLACLLRRLKSRLGSPDNFVCCVGTSATMGGNKEDVKSLLGYACEIFGESFSQDSIVTEDRLLPEELFTEQIIDFKLPTNEEISGLLKAVESDDEKGFIDAAIKAWIDSSFEYQNAFDDLTRIHLGERLHRHNFVRALLSFTNGKFAQNSQIIEELKLKFPSFAKLENASFALDCLYAVISHARTESARKLRPFLTVQVQLWMRELTRVLAKVTDQKITYALAGDLNAEQMKHYLPVVNCRDCGSTAWATILNEKHYANIRDLNTFYNQFFSGDESVFFFYPFGGNNVPEEFSKAFICPECMHVKFAASPTDDDVCAECGHHSIPVIYRKKILEVQSFGNSKHFVCPVCHSRNGVSMLGLRSATAISATVSQLFASKFNDDKKTLTFSDNVQDAAHRAGFFNSRTWRFVIREAIQAYVNDGGKGKSLADFQTGFVEYWKSRMTDEEFVSNFIPPNLVWMKAFDEMKEKGKFPKESGKSLMENIVKRLQYEVLLEYGLNSHVGRTLLKSGCSGLTYDETLINNAAFAVREYCINQLGCFDDQPLGVFKGLVASVVDMMRSKGGFNFGFYKTHHYLESLGRPFYLSNKFMTWLPGLGSSRSLPGFLYKGVHKGKKYTKSDFVDVWAINSPYTRLIENGLLSKTIPLTGLDTYSYVLQAIADQLVNVGLAEAVKFGEFIVYALRMDAFAVTDELAYHECGRCNQGRFFAENVSENLDGAPCPVVRCTGHLKQSEKKNPDYYHKLYNNSDLVRVFAREHTGLLERDDRQQLENSFKASKGERNPWDTNILSCTPTLEMGIDIGDLSSVILCSMPPEQAQYLQRAGRAGRKDGNALVVTVANARPHDLYFYADPLEMIQGQVQPPKVFLNASAVLERQFIAYCLDNWIKAGVTESAIPRDVGGVVNKLAAASSDSFPFNFLLYAQNNLPDLLSSFISAFPELNDTSIGELTAFAKGDGIKDGPMTTRVISAFQAVAKQKKSINNNISEINDRIKELQAKPHDSSYDEEMKELELEKKALGSVIHKMMGKDVFNFLSDEGLLPNYAFPESGVVLKAVLRRRNENKPVEPGEDGAAQAKKYQSIVYEINRSASSAISELAPLNTFYASGHKLVIDQIDLGTTEPEHWRLCPDCSHVERTDSPNAHLACCPSCGSTGWADDGQVRDLLKARMVYSTGLYDETLIDDSGDERTGRFYNKQTLIDVDEDHDVYKAFEMDNADFPFGYDFVKKAVIREINFGEKTDTGDALSVDGDDSKKAGFRICRHCGKVQGADDSKPRHTGFCKVLKQPDLEKDAYINCLYLYRELQTEALRILLPATTLDPTNVRVESFAAAFMLGLKEYFGNVDNLRVSVSEVPVPESTYRKQYLILYDSVPGGTGYLKQLLQNENSMIEILEKSLHVMKNCSCNDDPQKDGCYHCLYGYRQSQSLGSIRRSSAVDMFEKILDGKDNIKLVKSIGEINVDPLFDSELEKRFIEAIGTLGNANRPIEMKKDFVRNGSGYILKIGDCQWEIQPQVLLGEEEGVAVQCKPDFVFWPSKGNNQKPVAVFTDGFKYHKDRTDDDTLKREAIRRSGKFRVWSFSYQDVDSAFKSYGDYYTDPFMLSRLPAKQLYVSKIGSGLDFTKESPLSLFAAYLSDKNAEDTFTAKSQIYAWSIFNVASSGNSDYVEETLKSITALTDAAGIYPALSVNQVIVGNINFPENTAMKVYAALSKANKDEFYVCGLLDDKRTHDSAYEKDWNGFLLLMNIVQFLNNRSVVFTKKGVDEYRYSVLTPYQLVVDAEEDDDPWLPLMENFFEDDSIAFAKECSQSGVVPPSSIGFELVEGDAVIAEAEMVWEEQKIAFLTTSQSENATLFKNAGYEVVFAADGVSKLPKEA